jgi:CubicO group peptidase (beta-lactamase class C family)
MAVASETASLTSEAAQRALEGLLERRGIPGAGFIAVSDGRIVAEAAAGVANLDTGVPVTVDTIWQPGSIGKTYTAVLVMQLVDEGLIELDKPVAEHLQDLRLGDPETARSVTPRQLLTHTSGIDGDRLDESGAMFGRGDDAVQRYVTSLHDLGQITEPGTLWSYCNAGYVILGRLVEVVRGKPFEQVLREHLLQPAGMEHTFYFAEDVVQRNVAAGHLPGGPDGGLIVAPIWALGRANGPAGAIPYTTMRDLAGLAEIFLRRGVAANGTRILSETAVSEMLTPQVECPERDLLGDHWGLGVLIRDAEAPAVFGHDGNTIGLTAALRFVPERNLAYGVMCNREGANLAFNELFREIVDPWSGARTPELRRVDESVVVPHPEALLGVYRNVAGELTVSDENGRLTLRMRALRETAQDIPDDPIELRPVDGATFLGHVAMLGESVPLTFLERDASGTPRYIHFGARCTAASEPTARQASGRTRSRNRSQLPPMMPSAPSSPNTLASAARSARMPSSEPMAA